MKVIVAEKYGFCAGVRNAISTAEMVLAASTGSTPDKDVRVQASSPQAEKGKVYSLGPIIHNPDVVQRLAQKGLVTVDNVEQIPAGATVLIRSHGAGAQQLAHLKEKNAEIIDTTCVLVKRMQEIAAQMEEEGYKVVIVGDREHPEVQAVVGQEGGDIVYRAGKSMGEWLYRVVSRQITR
jgi:(E)-4-hydroxy-3-methyl-but-2-enyl pyrophosphate reductase